VRTADRPASLRDRCALGVFGDEVATALEDQLSLICAQGLSTLEFRTAWGVNVVDLSRSELELAAELLTGAGVRVSAIASPVGKSAVGADFEIEVMRLRRSIAAAQLLGTQLVRVFSFFPEGPSDGCRSEVLTRMSRLASEAAEQGVILALENESYVYGDTPARCREILDAVDSDALKMTFDPANFVQVGVRPHAEAWPELQDHVIHFHVKDAVSVDRGAAEPYPARVPDEVLMASVRPPGQGSGELEPLLLSLAESGYAGALVIEPHLDLWMREEQAASRFQAALSATRALLDRV
jgi:sugar phosphate isomerase/epimerase